MNSYTLADITPGMTESFTVTVTEAMMDAFYAVSGDNSPIHMDAEYAAGRGYPGRVVYGMLGASFLLLFEKPKDILCDVEWNTIFFFIGLFIIIGGLEASGGIKLMAEWIIDVTQGSQTAAGMLILWASGLISGVIDNIPYTATMSPMLVEISKVMGTDYTYPLWWCLSLGACLGGNLTIIGAAANVVVSEQAAKDGHPIAFMRFMKYGVVTVLISLVISSAYVYLKYFMH